MLRNKPQSQNNLFASFATCGRITDAFAWPSPLRYLLKYQICRFERNHCYPCWMCSAWAGSEQALLRARQQKCCQRRPTTHHIPAEHRGAHRKQDQRHRAAGLKNKVFIIFLQETYYTTADKLVIPNFSLAGSALPRPCHVCP